MQNPLARRHLQTKTRYHAAAQQKVHFIFEIYKSVYPTNSPPPPHTHTQWYKYYVFFACRAMSRQSRRRFSLLVMLWLLNFETESREKENEEKKRENSTNAHKITKSSKQNLHLNPNNYVYKYVRASTTRLPKLYPIDWKLIENCIETVIQLVNVSLM